MRANNQNKTVLLVTDDPVVESTVKQATQETGDALQHLKMVDDAMGKLLDVFASEAFAIVDLDTKPRRRRLLNTAAGILPVIAVTRASHPWLASMLGHHRIGASLSKPVTLAAMKGALQAIRHFHTIKFYSGN